MKVADIEVTLLDNCGTDLSVVNAARVSFDKESEEEIIKTPTGDGRIMLSFALNERDKKLVSYLARHKHTSPFNHCFASFRVKAPIFVARQLVKHKFLPWNEVSRRYVDSEPEFFIPDGLRLKADNVKQGSSDELLPQFMEDGFSHYHHLKESVKTALNSYKLLLDAGVCAEQARMVLPQNTMTEWIWSGTLGAWADMCRLRLDPHAQLESRMVAQKISDEMSQIYPESWKALINT